jgi:hypothetical protein
MAIALEIEAKIQIKVENKTGENLSGFDVEIRCDV